MEPTLTSFSQLGGTVFTVISFLWYLSKYQEKQVEAQIKLAVALENLTRIITSNSSASGKNTVAVDKNTEALQ